MRDGFAWCDMKLFLMYCIFQKWSVFVIPIGGTLPLPVVILMSPSVCPSWKVWSILVLVSHFIHCVLGILLHTITVKLVLLHWLRHSSCRIQNNLIKQVFYVFPSGWSSLCLFYCNTITVQIIFVRKLVFWSFRFVMLPVELPLCLLPLSHSQLRVSFFFYSKRLPLLHNHQWFAGISYTPCLTAHCDSSDCEKKKVCSVPQRETLWILGI